MEKVPPTRILDLFTKMDNLLDIQIRTSRRTNELLEMLLRIRPEVPVPAVLREVLPIDWGPIAEMLKPVPDYLSEDETAPKDYKLEDILHRSALNGYIANDGPGTLNIKINKLAEIPIVSGEVLDFTNYFKRPIEIKEVNLSSPTAADFRILLW